MSWLLGLGMVVKVHLNVAYDDKTENDSSFCEILDPQNSGNSAQVKKKKKKKEDGKTLIVSDILSRGTFVSRLRRTTCFVFFVVYKNEKNPDLRDTSNLFCQKMMVRSEP